MQSALSSWPRSIRWSLLRPPTTCLVLSPATLYWYTYLDINIIIIIIITSLKSLRLRKLLD